jgi:chromosome segregation ATPase
VFRTKAVGKDTRMKGLILRALALTIGAFIVLGAGCQTQESPDAKKSRLIAAENMRLEKELAQRGRDIERLKTQHDKEMKQQQEQLTKCLERKAALEKQLQENVKEQVESVLTAVVEENAKLQQEIKALKAQIEKLQEPIEAKPKPVETP